MNRSYLLAAALGLTLAGTTAQAADPLPDSLSLGGVTLYGTIDIGYAYQNHGANIWVTNYGSNNVTKLLATTGQVLGTFPAAPNPWGIAFDGAFMWVTGFGNATVSKY